MGLPILFRGTAEQPPAITGTVALADAVDTTSATGAEVFAASSTVTDAADVVGVSALEIIAGTVAASDALDAVLAEALEVFVASTDLGDARDGASVTGSITAPPQATASRGQRRSRSVRLGPVAEIPAHRAMAVIARAALHDASDSLSVLATSDDDELAAALLLLA